MGVSKVVVNNADGTRNVLVDLTGDTVTASSLAAGVTAHGADGELIVGTNHAGEWATAYTPSSFACSQSAATVVMTQIDGSANHGFELSDGGLKCPHSGIVIILGNAMLNTGYTANDIVHLRLYKGSTATGPDVKERKVSTSQGTLSISTIAGVSAGEVIYLKGYNETAARGTFNANASTRITVAYLR